MLLSPVSHEDGRPELPGPHHPDRKELVGPLEDEEGVQNAESDREKDTHPAIPIETFDASDPTNPEVALSIETLGFIALVGFIGGVGRRVAEEEHRGDADSPHKEVVPFTERRVKRKWIPHRAVEVLAEHDEPKVGRHEGHLKHDAMDDAVLWVTRGAIAEPAEVGSCGSSSKQQHKQEYMLTMR